MAKIFYILISLALVLPMEALASSGADADSSSGFFVGLFFVFCLWLGVRVLSGILEQEFKGAEKFLFLIVTAGIALLWAAYSPWYGGIFAALGGIVFLADNNRRVDFAKCRAIIETHGRELAIKRKQLVVPRGYGLQDETGWEKEKDFFLNTLVYEPVGRCTKLESFKEQVSALFDEIINSIDIKSADMNKNITPREYEQYVAEVLREHGWDAHATKGARDQGIDVIASKDGVKVVIQCKLYSNSVGNAAVQEIIAGREFIKADFAAVVSNIKYTLPAKQLAASSGVFLLHDAELPDLHSIIFESNTVS